MSDLLPESFSLASILAEPRCAPPERTLSQNDWLKTSQKLIPSPQNLRLQVVWQSCSGSPYPTALHAGALSQ